MNLKFDFDPENMDVLTVANLYNAYENCYYCIVDDKRRIDERILKCESYDWILEDLANSEEVLKAMEIIIKYFSRVPSDVEYALVEIQSKIDKSFDNEISKKRIAQMGQS